MGRCSGPAPGATDRTRTSGGQTIATPIASPIPHLARIDDGLYRGGQPDAQGYDELRRLGVRTIVSLRQHHDERRAVESRGFSYVHIPLQADIFGSEPPTEAQVREFFDVVLDPARRPVYFHCAHGQDRTGTMAALYRIEVDRWSNEDAVEEMHAFGYHDFFRDLIGYVRGYHPHGLAKSR